MYLIFISEGNISWKNVFITLIRFLLANEGQARMGAKATIPLILTKCIRRCLLSQTSQGILVLQLLLTFGSETFPRSWLYIWRSLRIAADLENLEQSGINWQVDYLTTWLPWLPQQVHCNLSSKAKTASDFVFYLYWLYLLQLFITWKFILTTYVRGCVKCT